jgi:hypothetical protein
VSFPGVAGAGLVVTLTVGGAVDEGGLVLTLTVGGDVDEGADGEKHLK